MSLRILSGFTAAIALVVWAHPAQAQRSESLAYPKVDASRLAIPEPTTGEIMGYPAVAADKRVIVQLLRARDFGQLDRFFDGTQAGVKRRIQLEFEWIDAILAFDTADPTLGPLLDEWVAARPTSAHALTARSTWYLARAWYSRGRGYANSVSDTAFQNMAGFAQQAANDAAAALQLDSTNLVAYSDLIRVALLSGGRQQATAVFDRARQIYPGSYYLARQYLYFLQPRWGGSFEAMAAFAWKMAGDSAVNPRLRTLLGAVEAERSDMATEGGHFEEGVAHAKAALSYGPEFYWLVNSGHSHIHYADNDRGIAEINAALAQRPQYIPALEFHGMAALSSSQYQEEALRLNALGQAKHDFGLILSIDPLNQYAIDGLKDVNNQLTNCVEDFEKCHEKDVGAGTIALEVGQHLWAFFKYLGIAAFIGLWGFIKWFRSGFWLPRYLHIIAFLALLTVCFIDVMWVKAGLPMTTERWLVIPVFPLMVYFLFIGLGGAGWAARR